MGQVNLASRILLPIIPDYVSINSVYLYSMEQSAYTNDNTPTLH